MVNKQVIIEAALMVAGEPLNIPALQNLFDDEDKPASSEVKEILEAIRARHEESGIALIEVASGFRLQTKADLSVWLAKLWERPTRYSRAFLETLAIIAYKQPLTRADIEKIRGVSVSSQIIRTLLDHEWIHIVSYLEAPGKPAVFATTKTFLDHFNLKSLADLPKLPEVISLDEQAKALPEQLPLENPGKIIPFSET